MLSLLTIIIGYITHSIVNLKSYFNYVVCVSDMEISKFKLNTIK